MKPQKNQPTRTTTWDDDQSFRVWAHQPAFDNDPAAWKCIAVFMFLGDCLEYIAARQDAGSDVVFQSPAHTKIVRHDDTRVVYKPTTEALLVG